MVTSKEVVEDIINLFELDLDATNVDESIPIYPDGLFELDSLDIVELISLFEDKYDIDLSDIDREQFSSIQIFTEYLNKKRKGR